MLCVIYNLSLESQVQLTHIKIYMHILIFEGENKSKFKIENFISRYNTDLNCIFDMYTFTST